MKKISLILVLVLAGIWASGQSHSSNQPLDQSNGLVAYFPFNGDANDKSGNGNNGTVEGATLTKDRFGINTNAYSFDGVNDFITIADNPDLFSDEMTISWWYKLTEVPGGAAVVIGWVDSGHRYQQFFSGGQLNYFNGYNVGDPSMYFNPIIDLADLNVWKNVVVTYKKLSASTSKTSIYIDGALKQTDTHALAMDYAPGINFLIGKNHNGNYFKGEFDDLRIYNRILEVAEISSLYSDSTSYFPSSNPLVAYYPFNGNAVDESGNGHDGTVYGGILTEDRNNNANSAYTFPNLHNQIVLANTTNLNLQGGFTLNSWVKYKKTNSTIIGKHNCWIPNGFVLQIDNEQIRLAISDGNWNFIITNGVFVEDKWYMVTGVFDSVNGTGSVYIDGQLKASGSAIYNNFSTAPITISEASNGCPDGNMPGAIDEVKIFNRPLSVAEIQTEYNLSHTGLVAFYPFSGNTNDESGNNLHLTNHGAILTADRFGIENNAYYFNGNANMSGIDNDLLDLINDFSISFWVKNPGSVLHQFVMSKHYAGEDNVGSWGIASYGEGDTYTFVATPQWGFGPPNPTTKAIPENVWHHVTFNYKKVSSEWRCFMDGLLSGSGTQTFNIQNTERDFMIGSCMQYNSGLTAYLDDMRVYTSALTDQDIEDLYLSETTAPVLLHPENLSTVSILTPLMEWENSNTNAEYNFQLSTEPGFAILLHQANTANSFIQLPDGILSKDITYYWRVRTTYNGETGPWSEVRGFSTLFTGLKRPLLTNDLLTLAPNPAINLVKISYIVSGANASKEPVTIEILNSLGAVSVNILDKKMAPGVYDATLATENLKPGIYYCRLRTVNQMVVRKLVITH